MIVEDVLKNQTDFIQAVTSTKLPSSSFSSLKNVALISNISRENTTRDLILTTTDDDSPMDDEELPETLPDVIKKILLLRNTLKNNNKTIAINIFRTSECVRTIVIWTFEWRLGECSEN